MTAAPDPRDLRSVYASRGATGSGPAVSRVERALLAETFGQVGAKAPTLSGDWDAHHLAAHLVLRESDPVSSLRASVPTFGDTAVHELAARAAFDDLVERFRTGPPQLSVFRVPGVESRLNSLEHLIHHEDVRRAQPDWHPRALPTWAQDQVWRALRLMAKVITRHAPVALTIERSDTGESSVARKGAAPVVVRGLPVELALYVYGRKSVAQVALDGDPEGVDRTGGATFSV